MQRSRDEIAARLLLASGLPMVILFLFADVPFVLLAQIWAMFVESHASGQSSPLPGWSAFLQSGGRLAIALALVALTVAMGRRMTMGRPGERHAKRTSRDHSSAA